jgi:hypothetical protein
VHSSAPAEHPAHPLPCRSAKMSQNVFFDITKNGSPMGRITFKLYDE